MLHRLFRRTPDLSTLLKLCQMYQAERDRARQHAIRQERIIRDLRVQLTMRPDPQHRLRRLAQFPPERQQRYLGNITALGTADVSTLTKGLSNGR